MERSLAEGKGQFFNSRKTPANLSPETSLMFEKPFLNDGAANATGIAVHGKY